MTKSLNAPEPDPIATDEVAIWDLVIEDMKERDADGRRRYGTPLQLSNGRDALVDTYQELLDAAVFIRQEIERQKVKERKIDMLENELSHAQAQIRQLSYLLSKLGVDGEVICGV